MMHLKFFKNTVLIFVLILISCGNNVSKKQIVDSEDSTTQDIEVGANQIELYLPIINGKRVGIVANQTSVIFNDKGYTHLVDSLLSLNIDVKKVFAPEHGFRGTADAGEVIKDGIDLKTGVPIISLYGDNKKPKLEQLKGTEQLEQDIESGISAIDILIFDLQDVGARFYTYISTLHYVMEACAEANITLLILDRPNPNGHYIDGPILESEHKSFVGMHPVPVVHGMTIGEYAQMINGEGWLKDKIKCDLQVISVENYSHDFAYDLPIKPSPNLPNAQAINLYPSLCFFEGTNVSAGRGTSFQFQIFGSPFLNKTNFTYEFTPIPNEGSKYPKHEGQQCYGLDLRDHEQLNHINLEWLIEAYVNTIDKDKFFNNFFIKLAGTAELQKQIEQGFTAQEIRKTWISGLDDFKKLRTNYLLYN